MTALHTQSVAWRPRRLSQRRTRDARCHVPPPVRRGDSGVAGRHCGASKVQEMRGSSQPQRCLWSRRIPSRCFGVRARISLKPDA